MSDPFLALLSPPTDDPEYGCCRCGCGQTTRIATRTQTARGWVRGEPIPYVVGHSRRIDRTNCEAHFWERVSKGPDCWEWRGLRLSSGYGQMGVSGRMVSAHRLSYELHCGPIPDGMFVCHRCDNPPCVRPDHLFLGSALDNRRDCQAKGRVTRGEAHGGAKLTESDVRAIRADVERGIVTRTLAGRYGVSQATINRVALRKAWAWLD